MNHGTSVLRIVVRRLTAVSCIVGLVGCGAGGSTGPAVYSAKGSVTVNGKPAYGALVVLHPIDKSNELRPSAEADDDGQFVLTSLKAGDGAPVGDYQVAIKWVEEEPPTSPPTQEPGKITSLGGEGAESKQPPKDRLEGRYADPQTSGLKCTITSQADNEIPVFELK